MVAVAGTFGALAMVVGGGSVGGGDARLRLFGRLRMRLDYLRVGYRCFHGSRGNFRSGRSDLAGQARNGSHFRRRFRIGHFLGGRKRREQVKH